MFKYRYLRAVLAGALLTAAAQAQTLVAAKVLSSEGPVEIRRAQQGQAQMQPITFKLNTELNAGDTIMTGKKGRLVLGLSDGSQAVIGAQTTVVIQDLQQAPRTLFNVLRGKTRVHIEKLGGKSYLERRGWVAGSNVYKVAAFNFNPDARLQTLADGKAGPGFEELLEIENDSGNHGAIVQTVKALADDGTPFATSFNRHFDRNNYLAWLASAILLGNWDTVNQNFGLYQPLGGDRFYFLPWDYDGALGYPQQPGFQPGGPGTIPNNAYAPPPPAVTMSRCGPSAAAPPRWPR